MNTPKGYDEMVKMFGDINPYINEDGTINSTWERRILQKMDLPYALRLSWNGQPVTALRCHYILVGLIDGVFKKIFDENLENECKEFGGCYMFRAQVGSKKISTHAWGISLDLEPTKNPLGGPSSMNLRVIEIFESMGFVWGGNFKRVDPMHFQFVEGY